MRTSRAAVMATSLILAASAAPLAAGPAAGADAVAVAAVARKAPQPGPRSISDNLSQPWRKRYEAIHQAGLERRLRQRARGGPVQKVGPHTYSRVAQRGTDKIFVVLAQFGDTVHSAFPSGVTDAKRFDGPLHNQIPRPNRSTDNSTVWQPNYSSKHYQNMYFSRMRRFYETQSSGTYSLAGQVSEWVKVPFNQARYGRDFCGDVVCNSTWFLVRDALAVWTKSKLDSGWSMGRIRSYLKSFDHQDRYDFDGDGNFNEPDGYIDHFQIVHAGGDEADGDPTYGEDAIWSHRWNAQVQPFGTGPVGGADIGGVNVGEGGPSDGGAVQIPDNPTGVWVNDYTIQPENGGLGVFAHEFGHDLGLPDLYDTSGGSENNIGFWSLMSQSRGTGVKDTGIGERAMPFGAWEKFQLGWLRYDVTRSGRTSTHLLQPNSLKAKKHPNGLVVLLPDKHVPLDLGDPCATCGERYYYSGSGNDLSSTMTRAVTVAAATPLTATVRYDIEPGFDYAFLEASSDGGETWTSLPTSESYDGADEGGTNPDGTGISGSTEGQWVDLTATVPAGTEAIRWHYLTDGALVLPGFQVDNITLGGTNIGDAETDGGWTFDGFRATTGSEDQTFLNAYFVDNRQYIGSDALMKHLYYFPDRVRRPDRVAFYRNNPGALISYWDTSYSDNNVGVHPGHGQVLPVDATPDLTHVPQGALARPQVLAYDATFSPERSELQFFRYKGARFRLKAHPGVSLFNDRLDWWFANDEHGSEHVGPFQPGWYGVDVPKTGTTIRIVGINKSRMMTVRVGTSTR